MIVLVRDSLLTAGFDIDVPSMDTYLDASSSSMHIGFFDLRK